MVGNLAENAISAVGIGGQIMFFTVTLAGAAASAISILAAQFNGARNRDEMSYLTGTGFALIFLSSCLFGFLLFHYSYSLSFWLSNGNIQIAELSSRFLQIVSLSTPLVLVTFVIVGIMRSLKDTVTPLISSITAVFLNTGLNYLLINGNLGFPALGVTGTALATTIAQTVSFLIVIYYFQRKKFPEYSFEFGHLLKIRFTTAKKISKITFPIALDALFWQAASLAYTKVIGNAGKEALPAYFIFLGIRSMGFIPLGALGTGAATLVGRHLGAGNKTRTRSVVRQSFFLILFFSLIMSAFFNLSASFYLGYFVVENQVKELAISLIRYFSIVILFEGVIVLLSGVLRAGGDALMVSLITFSTFWFIGIPVAWLFGIFFNLGMKGCFIGIAMESICKAFLFNFRERKGNWARNLAK